MESQKMRVSGLLRYPIKGCRGEAVEMLNFDHWGPIHDRRWMIIDEADNVVTQEEIPALACLKATKLTGNKLGLVWYGSPFPEPFVTTYHVGYPSVNVNVCGQACPTFMAYETVHPWLSSRLGRPVRLVRIKRDLDRSQHRNPYCTGFANGSHVLITTEESHNALTHRLPHSIPHNRFRPSIVLAGISSFKEDAWVGRHLWIGGVIFVVTRPHLCGTGINIDQHTGKSDNVTLTALAEVRKSTGELRFGIHAEHQHRGAIRLHDPVRLLRSTPH